MLFNIKIMFKKKEKALKGVWWGQYIFKMRKTIQIDFFFSFNISNVYLNGYKMMDVIQDSSLKLLFVL